MACPTGVTGTCYQFQSTGFYRSLNDATKLARRILTAKVLDVAAPNPNKLVEWNDSAGPFQ